MVCPNDSNSVSSKWLAQDPWIQGGDYDDYRAKLARTIDSAEGRERLAFWVCAVSGVVSFLLLFVGGSEVTGSFDPWSKSATALSVTLGAIFVASSILFWVLIAAYYSRFRPQTRQARENLRDIQQLQLAARIEALQKEMALLKERLPVESRREPE